MFIKSFFSLAAFVSIASSAVLTLDCSSKTSDGSPSGAYGCDGLRVHLAYDGQVKGIEHEGAMGIDASPGESKSSSFEVSLDQLST